MSSSDSSGSVMKSVDRAFGILRFFSVAEPQLGLSEITRRTGLNKATVHRILTALARNGLVEQNPENRKYRLGAEFLRFARVREAAMPLSELLPPLLHALVAELNETAHATLPSTDGMLNATVVEAQRTTRVYADPSETLPFHATASGLAFSAYAPPERRKDIAARALVRHTDATPMTADALAAVLGQVRERGYALARGTYSSDTTGVAAPIFDASGHAMACIAVAGILTRMDDAAIDRAAKAVRRAALQATREVGGVLPEGLPAL